MNGLSDATIVVLFAFVIGSLIALFIIVILLWRDLRQMAHNTLPREGFPQQVEASWEDIGERGRFLTDLGGMSEGMKEQVYDEFVKALNRPVSGIPAAGSVNDMLVSIDQWLLEKERVTESTE